MQIFGRLVWTVHTHTAQVLAGSQYTVSFQLLGDLRRPQYIDRQGREVRVFEEEDDKNLFNDLIITSLRTASGLNPARIPAKFAEQFHRTASRLTDLGQLASSPDGHIYIPEDRWLTSDAILVELIEV